MGKKRSAKKKRFGRKDAQVVFKVESAEKERFIEASERAEMEFSDWLRAVVGAAAEEVLNAEEE